MDKVTRDWIGQGVSCFGVDSTLQSQQLQLGSFAGGLLPRSVMHICLGVQSQVRQYKDCALHHVIDAA